MNINLCLVNYTYIHARNENKIKLEITMKESTDTVYCIKNSADNCSCPTQQQIQKSSSDVNANNNLDNGVKIKPER